MNDKESNPSGPLSTSSRDAEGDSPLLSGVKFVDALEELETVYKRRVETSVVETEQGTKDSQGTLVERAYRLARERVQQRDVVVSWQDESSSDSSANEGDLPGESV